MIQRIQSLFLFQLVLLGIVLMFIPCVYVLAGGESHDVYLLPANTIYFRSSAGHWAAIFLNFLGLVLAFVTVFLYRQRLLQRRLCFIIAALWAALTLMIAFCPFIEGVDTPASATVNYYAVVIGALGTMGALLAARFIKRDIELLKSADRIR